MSPSAASFVVMVIAIAVEDELADFGLVDAIHLWTHERVDTTTQRISE
jgi:hypothetical protein